MCWEITFQPLVLASQYLSNYLIPTGHDDTVSADINIAALGAANFGMTQSVNTGKDRYSYNPIGNYQ